MLGVIIFCIAGGCIWAWIDYSISNNADKRKKRDSDELSRQRQALVDECEANRGSEYRIWRLLTFRRDDIYKLVGQPMEFDNDLQLFLVLATDGTVHVPLKKEMTPNFKLVAIDYQGQYTQSTVGNVSGNAGDAFLGGVLGGAAGAQIGAAQSRTINATTTSSEVDDWGLLTFAPVDGGQPVVVQTLLNKNAYQSLYKDFMWREETPVEPIEENVKSSTPEQIALLAKLSHAHEEGILTDQEFADKVANIQ